MRVGVSPSNLRSRFLSEHYDRGDKDEGVPEWARPESDRISCFQPLIQRLRTCGEMRSILEDDWQVLKARINAFTLHDTTSKFFLDAFDLFLKNTVCYQITSTIVVPEAEAIEIAAIQVF